MTSHMQPAPKPSVSPEKSATSAGSLRLTAPPSDKLFSDQKSDPLEAFCEDGKLVEHHYAYVNDQWALFQRTKYGAPPQLLPLEASQELNAFREFLEKGTVRTIEQTAIDRFEANIKLEAVDAEHAVEAFQTELQSTPLFYRLLKLMSLSSLRDLLRKCIVSITPPNLGPPAHEAIVAASKLLRRRWSERIEYKQQALFSVHRNANMNVIHLGSASYGSVFVTVPHLLEPEALAEELLSAIKNASAKLIPQDNTIAVIDGDYQTLNYQKMFKSNIVVRSVKDDCDRFASNLDKFLHRDPPTASNSALHLGLPANEAELNAVFPSGRGDWDLWNSVSPLWQSSANDRGFDRPVSASAQQVLNSLTQDENVIVVVAHADQQTLFMPAPPPHGSQLTAEQIIAHKDAIAANKPVVYLFCCETAEISNLKSFSEILLECGAAAVIAPQTTIDAKRCVKFFEGVVEKEVSPGGNSLTKIKAAQRQSNYQEMEIWLG